MEGRQVTGGGGGVDLRRRDGKAERWAGRTPGRDAMRARPALRSSGQRPVVSRADSCFRCQLACSVVPVRKRSRSSLENRHRPPMRRTSIGQRPSRGVTTKGVRRRAQQRRNLFGIEPRPSGSTGERDRSCGIVHAGDRALTVDAWHPPNATNRRGLTGSRRSAPHCGERDGQWWLRAARIEPWLLSCDCRCATSSARRR